ncbi:MAG: hypothetical protein Aurels2KO_43780 [Aureliella sp.]
MSGTSVFQNALDQSHGVTSQVVRIPLRLVDSAYGYDNHDNAGDDVVYCLRTASDYPDQYRMDFAFDTAHDNPWYHAMVYTIHGITESHYDRFVELLADHKLLET